MSELTEGQKFLFPELECKSCKEETYNTGLCDECAEAWAEEITN